MNNLSYSECIIVYAIQWPETYAIEGLYNQVSLATQIEPCFSPESLIELLEAYTTAPVILGILPHESVLLLSRLTPYLQQRRILFFGQKFNYADRVVPFYFLPMDIEFIEWTNNTPKKILPMLSSLIIPEAVKPEIDKNHPTPLLPSNADELIYHVNIYIYQMLSNYGVGKQSRRVLLMLASSLSIRKIAKILDINIKTVSLYKLKGLYRLGMGTSSYDVYRGIFVNTLLQQYRPDDKCHQKMEFSSNRVKKENNKNLLLLIQALDQEIDIAEHSQ